MFSQLLKLGSPRNKSSCKSSVAVEFRVYFFVQFAEINHLSHTPCTLHILLCPPHPSMLSAPLHTLHALHTPLRPYVSILIGQGSLPQPEYWECRLLINIEPRFFPTTLLRKYPTPSLHEISDSNEPTNMYGGDLCGRNSDDTYRPMPFASSYTL